MNFPLASFGLRLNGSEHCRYEDRSNVFKHSEAMSLTWSLLTLSIKDG